MLPGDMKRHRLHIIKIILLCLTLTLLMPVTVLAGDASAINRAFLDDINALRATQGLGKLEMDNSLVSVAKVRAEEASTTWSHTRPNGTQGVSMLPKDKWRGENLSYVQYGEFTFTPAEQTEAEQLMFANLKASPTHLANMVHKNFTKIGIYTYVSQTGSGTKLTSAFMFTN